MESTFDLGIDSRLRACDLLSLRVHNVCHGDRMAARAIVLQNKTERPVQQAALRVVFWWSCVARLDVTIGSTAE